MSGRDGHSGVGWRMNLFVFITLLVTGGFVVASIHAQGVILTLRSELNVEKKRADEKRFSLKILAGGLESRLDFMLNALQRKRDHGERPGN